MKIKFFILPVILLVLLVACATTGPKGPAQRSRILFPLCPAASRSPNLSLNRSRQLNPPLILPFINQTNSGKYPC